MQKYEKKRKDKSSFRKTDSLTAKKTLRTPKATNPLHCVCGKCQMCHREVSPSVFRTYLPPLPLLVGMRRRGLRGAQATRLRCVRQWRASSPDGQDVAPAQRTMPCALHTNLRGKRHSPDWHLPQLRRCPTSLQHLHGSCCMAHTNCR